MKRLQKIIAERGYTSRRKAEELIVNGKVKVDGIIIKELGVQFSDDVDIEIDGKHLKQEDKVYYLLNKPSGYISSLSDELGRKVITELIATDKRIFPIGRLDYDTTGLILLTNDGELANILMHPKNKVEKTYLAKVEGILTPYELNNLKKGIKIDGIKCIPTRVKVRKRDKVKNTDLVEISLIEGRNHIVKNLFQEIGHPVNKLTRIRYGFLELDNLKSKEYRLLCKEEIKKLYTYKKIWYNYYSGKGLIIWKLSF